jgi:hypothetical protein
MQSRRCNEETNAARGTEFEDFPYQDLELGTTHFERGAYVTWKQALVEERSFNTSNLKSEERLK